MRLIFTFLSIFYIAAIFLFAGSSVISKLAAFNPYSLLHIPLYGILTILIIFSFLPIKLNSINQTNQRNQRNQRNQINQRDQRDFFIIGIAPLIIGIADEIHQSFIPMRNASVIDVFLDAIGILLALSIYYAIVQKKLRTYLAD